MIQALIVVCKCKNDFVFVCVWFLEIDNTDTLCGSVYVDKIQNGIHFYLNMTDKLLIVLYENVE